MPPPERGKSPLLETKQKASPQYANEREKVRSKVLANLREGRKGGRVKKKKNQLKGHRLCKDPTPRQK